MPGFRPLADKVLIKRTDPEKKTPGGIYIPPTAQEKSIEGIVVAVGPGKYVDGKLVPIDLKPGDHIIFSRYNGTDIEVEGAEHTILSDNEILGVILK